MSESTLNPHPLDHAGVTRIVVSDDLAEVLESVGRHCLIVSTRGDNTCPPDMLGKPILCCFPVEPATADDLWRVARGKARAVTIKEAPPAKPSNPTAGELKRA